MPNADALSRTHTIHVIPRMESGSQGIFPRSSFFSSSSRPPTRKGKSLTDRWIIIRRIVEWARGEYFGSPSAGPARHFSKLLGEIGRVLAAQGAPGAIAWIKRRRQEYLGFLASDPSSREGRRFRNKLVSHFGRSQARVLLKRRSPVIRMVLTALTSLRALSLPVKIDISSVVNPFIGTSSIPWRSYVRSFWAELRRGGKVRPANSVL